MKKQKSCRNCVFEVWAIGVGQGVFCLAGKNEHKDLGFGMHKSGRPLIPAEEEFFCTEWVRDTCG